MLLEENGAECLLKTDVPCLNAVAFRSSNIVCSRVVFASKAGHLYPQTLINGTMLEGCLRFV